MDYRRIGFAFKLNQCRLSLPSRSRTRNMLRINEMRDLPQKDHRADQQAILLGAV
jgi:hypothetical protein